MYALRGTISFNYLIQMIQMEISWEFDKAIGELTGGSDQGLSERSTDPEDTLMQIRAAA